jgi:hypothetical protein
MIVIILRHHNNNFLNHILSHHLSTLSTLLAPNPREPARARLSPAKRILEHTIRTLSNPQTHLALQCRDIVRVNPSPRLDRHPQPEGGCARCLGGLFRFFSRVYAPAVWSWL